MKTNCSSRPKRGATALLVLVLLAGMTIAARDTSAQTAPRRTQTLQLHRGWNAVFLEVIPTNSTPASVFAGAPVNIVATFLGTETTVQFIRDPASIGWKKEGWGVWYAPHRPDSFLSTLHAVAGYRAYLIQAERDFTWSVEGQVELARMVWKADSFNFTGFTLDPQSPPTFEKFFGGSKSHRASRIFRLVNDHWELVTNPPGTVMRAGEAFWVECQGSSDYQGPLRIQSTDGNRLSFGARVRSQLIVANESTDPATVSVETVGTQQGLPLAYTISAITDTGPGDVDAALPAHYGFGTLEPGARNSLRLKVWRDRMTSPVGATLLKISNGAGALTWVPVTAQREDLSAASQ